MATIRFFALLLTLIPSLVHTADCWAQVEQSPADRAAAIKRDHAALEKSFYEELVAAKRDNKKIQDANERYREAAAKNATALKDLINEHSADPAALDAAITLVGDVSYPLGDGLAKIVLDHHFGSESMGQLCLCLRSRGDEPWAVKILEACAAKHPQKDVRGQATFVLGDGYRLVARPFGDPPPNADKLLEKAKRYYEQVVDNFSDVSTPDGKWNLGERAKHELIRLRNLSNLQVGRPAPSIEGMR